jgi:hypothetical protein
MFTCALVLLLVYNLPLVQFHLKLEMEMQRKQVQETLEFKLGVDLVLMQHLVVCTLELEMPHTPTEGVCLWKLEMVHKVVDQLNLVPEMPLLEWVVEHEWNCREVTVALVVLLLLQLEKVLKETTKMTRPILVLVGQSSCMVASHVGVNPVEIFMCNQVPPSLDPQEHLFLNLQVLLPSPPHLRVMYPFAVGMLLG